MAGKLGFYQSDIFHGTIQNCGADFYRQVPTVHATSWLSRTGQPYGTFEATDEEIVQAKRVRFVLVTGTNDFRRGNILDIFNGGFAKEGFKAKLLTFSACNIRLVLATSFWPRSISSNPHLSIDPLAGGRPSIRRNALGGLRLRLCFVQGWGSLTYFPVPGESDTMLSSASKPLTSNP